MNSPVIGGVLGLLFVFGLNFLLNQHFPRPPPVIEKDGYFGPGEVSKDDTTVHDFKIDVPSERLEDLRTRMMNPRHLSALEDGDNELMLHFLSTVMEISDKFDWNQHQYFMNTFKQYRTEIEGLQIHFVRVATPPSSGKQMIPLVLLHGFPSSWWNFFKVAPILSNPHRYGFDFGVKKPILFDVIIPSLPGFLWSDKPAQKGLGVAESARILHSLMKRLNVNKYFVHGGEGLGAQMAAALASLYPTDVLGLHMSNPFLPPLCDVQTTALYGVAQAAGFGEDEDRPSTTIADYLQKPQFQVEQRPDAAAIPLLNTPYGLVTYILDRWHVYSNGNETSQERLLHQMFTIDELLTEVHLYWLTDTIPHALRLMAQAHSADIRCQLELATVSVPTAIVQTPDSPWRTSKSILEHKYQNITRYSILSKGGLFHSLQDAHALAADIFRFVEIEAIGKNW